MVRERGLARGASRRVPAHAVADHRQMAVRGFEVAGTSPR